MELISVCLIFEDERELGKIKSILSSSYFRIEIVKWPVHNADMLKLADHDVIVALLNEPDRIITSRIKALTDAPVFIVSHIPADFDVMGFIQDVQIKDVVPPGHIGRLPGAVSDVLSEHNITTDHVFSLPNNPHIRAYDHEGIIVSDEEGYVLWVNKRCEEDTGYTLHEMFRKKPGDILQGPDTDRKIIEKMSEMVAKGLPFAEEVLNYRKNGETYWLKLKVSPVRDNNGVIRHFIAFQEDITEQKGLQNTLSQTMGILSKAQEIGKLGHWRYDALTGEILWSEQVFRIYGRDIESGAPDLEEIKDLVYPSDRKLADSAVEESLKTGRSYDLELRLNRDEPTYIRAIGIPKINASGVVIGLEGIIQDITVNVLNEERLTTISDQLQDMADNIEGLILQYILYTDESDGILYVSEGVERIFDISREEALNDVNLIWEKILDEDRPLVKSKILESAKKLSLFEIAVRLKRPDKEITIIKATGLPRLREDGAIIWNTVIIDITNEVMAERDRSELQDLVSDTLSEIYIFDAESLQFVYTNVTAMDNLLYTKQELRSLTPLDVMKDLQREEFIDLLVQAERDKGIHLNTGHQRKDGSMYQVFMNLKSGVFKGKKVYIANAMDASLIVEQREQLKEMISEKNILIGEINHRVKNNLAIISGLIELQTIGDQSKEELNEVKNRIQAIAAVHEQLYNTDDFSHIEVSSYLQSLIDNSLGSALSNGSKVDVNVSTEVDILNINEAVPMGLLINELLVNSIKHAFPSDGGTIHITLNNTDNGQILFEYSDSGKGFDKAILEKASIGNSGFGMVLIKTLIGQFSDNYELYAENGFVLRFCFDRLFKGAYGSM